MKYVHLSFLLLLCGCKGNLDGPAPTPKYYLSFAPRDVNYVWMKPTTESGSLRIILTTYNQLMHGGIDARYAYAETWQQIDRAIPELEAAYENSCYIFLIYDNPIYLSIPEQAERVYKEEHRTDGKYDGPVLPDLVEYRNDRVASLSITADTPFCGRSAGSELNDLFFMRPDYPGFYASGQIMSPRETLPLVAWISNDPYVPAVGVLTADAEMEQSATITIELTTTSGKRFRASKQIVSRCQSSISKYLHDDFMCSIADEFLAERVD